MRLVKELLPGITISPRIIRTVLGEVEFDLTDGNGPVVLGVHGGLGGVDQARLLLSWLNTTQYRLLSPSRPGYLGTPLSSGKSFEEQADLFAALLDALAIDKVAVVTLSAGGPPGYYFAIRHPDRICALIAIDSVCGYYTMPETAGPLTQAIFMSQPGQNLMKFIGHKKPEWLLHEMFHGIAYYNKQQLETHINFTLDSPPALAFARGLMETFNPYKPRLAGNNNDMELFRQLTHVPIEKIRCPTLIVHGTHDADVKFYDGVYAYEHIQNAERFWIEAGSHLGFWLSPHAMQAQEAAREFLARYCPNR